MNFSAVCRLALPTAFCVLVATSALAGDSVWAELKPLIYPGLVLNDGRGLIQFQAPIRAEDQRHMSVSAQAAFKDGRKVKSLTFIIDENPAPVSARFKFGEAGRDKVDLGLTLRLDGPSEMHVVAEASDGQLYVVGQEIKASGAGVCAATPIGDQQEATNALGTMTLTDITEKSASSANATQLKRKARLDIRHPSNSGLQRNQITLLYLPMRAVSDVEVKLSDTSIRTVWLMAWRFSSIADSFMFDRLRIVALPTFADSEPRGSAFLNRYETGSPTNISYQMPMPIGAPSSELTGVLRRYS